MSSTSSTTNALLSFPARLHGPLLEALQRRSEKKSSDDDDGGGEAAEALVCSLDRATGATRVLARRDLSRERDLFLFEPLASGTRSGLARRAVGDERARSLMSEVVAEALLARIMGGGTKSGGGSEKNSSELPLLPPLPPFSGSETSDPLLNRLWGWLLPAGVGIDAGGSGRPDARWALPPKEIAWAQQHSGDRAPNARVSLLTLDDDDDDEGDDDVEEEKEQSKGEEERLLLVLWLEENVPRGEALTLDWSFEVPEASSSRSGSSLSVCRAASLVARLGDGRWSEGPEGRGKLAAAVEAAAAAAGPPAGAGGAAERHRRRQAQQQQQQQQSPAAPTLSLSGSGGGGGGRDFLVWSDYPVFSEWLDSLGEEAEEAEKGGGDVSASSSSSRPLLGLLPRSSRRRLRRTRDRSEADLVLSRLPLRSFLGSEEGRQQLSNQFPFEGALVRKDLLPSTARSALPCSSGDESGGGENGGGESGKAPPAENAAAAFVVCWPPSQDGLHPPWFPPTFDLSTELHYLLREIEKEKEEKGQLLLPWIIKPATATRSLGLAVSASSATLAAFAMRAAAGGDRVAQRYVERPVLTDNGRKFDLRLYVVVRSFGDGGGGGEEREEEEGEEEDPRRPRPRPRASLYLRYHAREAPRRYCPPREHSRGLISQSVFGTVACYNEGGKGDGEEEEEEEEEKEGAATTDPFLPREAVDALLRSRGHDPRAVALAVASLARKVVEAGARVIGGPWPRSRAVYGLDVVLDESERTRVEVESEGGGKAEEEEEEKADAAAAASAKEGEEGRTKRSRSTTSVLVPTPRLLEVNFAPDLAVAARFNPDLPGLLLREMLREDDDDEDDDDGGDDDDDDDEMFLRLF